MNKYYISIVNLFPSASYDPILFSNILKDIYAFVYVFWIIFPYSIKFFQVQNDQNLQKINIFFCTQ